MKKNPDYPFLLAIVATPVLIYFYFLTWRTYVIYGDDTVIFLYQAGAHTLADKLNIDVAFQKFRPIHGVSIEVLFALFKKNTEYYYLFNIAIQTINTFVFARILHLFLSSRALSLCWALIIGISRFSLFNITQLFDGGALEGLAMTFFLLSLFYILKALMRDDLPGLNLQRALVSAILFANLSVYTHERYIVLFPFLVLALLFFPGLRALSRRRRSLLVLAAIGSVILNIILKKYVCSLPFFVGTGGSMLSFSVSTVLSFFIRAILSICQINSGPAYLMGISFSSLPFFDKLLVLLFAGIILAVTLLYLNRIRKAYMSGQKEFLPHFYLLIFLFILFLLLLAPAVVSIHLEQRWLQASSAIFVLMLVIVLSDWRTKGRYSGNTFRILMVILFIVTDYNYLNKGGEYIYMNYSQKEALRFREAMDKGIIRPATRRLFLYERQKDVNNENAIRWDLGDGGFFSIYQNGPKQLVFGDSLYREFNGNTDQMLYPGDDVKDITGYFLKDSLRTTPAFIP